MQIIAASRDDFERDKVENSFRQIQVGQYKRRKISCEEYKNKVAIDNICVGRVKALLCILVLFLAALCLVIFKTAHLHNVIEMNASIKASLELLAKHRIGISALMRCNCVNEVFIFTQLFDRMCMALGGRAAEAKIFKRVTTGMFSRVFSFHIMHDSILPVTIPPEICNFVLLGGLFPTPGQAERDNSPPPGLLIDHKYPTLFCEHAKHRLRY